MPAYATQQNIIDTYGNDVLVVAADRDGDGNADAGVVDEALNQATAEMDSYIAVKYELPLPSVPAVLVPQCVDIALYRLSLDANAMTEEIRQRYEDAVAWLKAIAAGKASLGLPDAPPSSGGGVQITGPARQFTRDTLKGV